MAFLINYDLVKSNDYAKLWEALRVVGARRVLYSTWATHGVGSTAKGLREYLQSFIDQDDRLIVVEYDDWSSYNALINLNDL